MTLSASLFITVLELTPPRLEPPLQDGDLLGGQNKRNEMDTSKLVHQAVSRCRGHLTTRNGLDKPSSLSLSSGDNIPAPAFGSVHFPAQYGITSTFCQGTLDPIFQWIVSFVTDYQVYNGNGRQPAKVMKDTLSSCNWVKFPWVFHQAEEVVIILVEMIIKRLAEAKNSPVSYNNVDCYSDGKCKYLSMPDELDQKCKQTVLKCGFSVFIPDSFVPPEPLVQSHQSLESHLAICTSIAPGFHMKVQSGALAESLLCTPLLTPEMTHRNYWRKERKAPFSQSVGISSGKIGSGARLCPVGGWHPCTGMVMPFVEFSKDLLHPLPVQAEESAQVTNLLK
ncbi:hypothetical protein WISP_07736 [Willisornis vidua]|uniref:Uncharacterized protein n=1 Tax=Willisornis vidua TaxID=1566151 RepID=A0ABQ9DT12_9PASS|nr:hypothetical protein WISP_07736 [Willisornis vidua]